MNNELMIFEGNQVEVFELNDVVYFNPYHVGECLGITKSTVKDHISNMNENQVVLLTNLEVGSIDLRKLNNRGEKFLTESGVYKLIFKSKKPEAEKFTDWVTDEVLPSIRKEGVYITDKANPEMLRNKADEIESLSVVNETLKIVMDRIDRLPVAEESKMLVMKGILKKAGLDIPIDIQAEQKYYDGLQIAKEIGIYSGSNKPHTQAVNAIIDKIEILDSEKKDIWETNGSWQGTVTKYTKKVIEKVTEWLIKNNYPPKIVTKLSNGKDRNFAVIYKEA